MQFNVKACSIQGIFKTADVVKNDPSSVACPAGSMDVMSEYATVPILHPKLAEMSTLAPVEQMIRFPIAPEELDRYKDLLGKTKPPKPYAFIFGHGLWNVSLLGLEGQTVKHDLLIVWNRIWTFKPRWTGSTRSST